MFQKVNHVNPTKIHLRCERGLLPEKCPASILMYLCDRVRGTLDWLYHVYKDQYNHSTSA